MEISGFTWNPRFQENAPGRHRRVDFCQKVDRASREVGRNLGIVSSLEGVLEQAGFQEVVLSVSKLPIGSTCKDLKGPGDLTAQVMKLGADGMALGLFGDSIMDDVREFEKAIDGIDRPTFLFQ